MRPEVLTRIRSWFNGGSAPPYHIEITPTNQCNIGCIACRARGKCAHIPNEEEKMIFDVYKGLFSEAKRLGVKEMHLTGGGEPLMHKGIFKIMKEIKKNEIRGSIVTNGSLFNKKLIKGLIKAKWDNILYSLDGPDAETHDILRKKGVFDRVIQSIKLFNFYKKKYGQKEPCIELCLVLSSYNYNKLFSYLDLAYSLDIKKVFIQPIRINDKKLGGKLILTDEQKREFQDSISLLLEKSDKFGIHTNLDELDEFLIKKSCEIKEVIETYSKQKKEEKDIMKSLSCYSPWYFIGIRPNGDIYPCGADCPNPFGNIITDTLENIWYGQKFEDFRQKLLSKNVPDFCAACCGMSVLVTKNIQNNI